MDITLVKNPAKRRTRKAKSSKAATTRKSSKRSAAAKKAWRTRRRNAAARKTRSNPKKRTSASRSKAAKKAAATRKRNASRKSRRTTRKNPVNVVERVPVIGKMKIAKTADKEISPMAHGAQKWKTSSMPQKAVQVVGGFTGYGYGGSFTQMGQNFSDSALIGSGAGLITGVGGIAATSWAVNTVMGDMLLKKHEGKHHTFANFTKGWKIGGYVGVGLNTVTNLLTMAYGRSYSGLGSWSQLVDEAKHSPMASLKKAVVKSSGAHKLAHLPAVANLAQGMYAMGPDGPLQGFSFGNSPMAADQTAPAAAHYGADAYTEINGYYGDNNDVLGYVDVMGDSRAATTPVGHVDVLGYPSGVGYPAEFAENQPIFG